MDRRQHPLIAAVCLASSMICLAVNAAFVRSGALDARLACSYNSFNPNFA
jgi:hypothetical protein